MTLALQISELIYTGRILPLAAYVGLTLLAFVILARNTANPTNRIFALLSFIASLWNVAVFIALGSTNPSQALAAWKFYEIMVLALVPTWTYFATYFAGRRISPSLLYAPSIAFVPVLLFTEILYKGTAVVGKYYLPARGGELFIVYNLYILFFILYGLGELLRAYGSSSSTDRQRIKWMSIGIGIVVLSGTIDAVLSLADVASLPFSPALSIFAVLGMGYSFTIEEGEF